MAKDGFRQQGALINYGMDKLFVAECTWCGEEKARTSPEKRDAWKARHRRKCRR